MRVSINEINGLWTAAVEGRLDSVTSPQFEQDIQPLLLHCNESIVLDLKELEYISSAGLRQLLAIRKASLAKGGSVVIANVQSSIKQILAITGFTSLFEFAD